MNDKIKTLREIVKERQDDSDPAHDFLHIERVVALCEKLGAAMNARLDLLLPAAWLHDIVNLPKNHPDRESASLLAAKAAQEILAQLAYESEEIEAILKIIKEHSYSAGHAPTSLESQILQDADRLDAIGAIGILRLAATGGKLKSKFYDPLDPFAAKRDLDDKKYSLDHLPKKLFKLRDKMNTPLAKQEAEKRTRFLELILEELREELSLICHK